MSVHLRYLCFRFNGGNVSDAVLNGSSIHIQLDMTSKITLLLACLYESTGRDIAVMSALASASGVASALLKCLSFWLKFL